jgi:hypothetical protein
MPEPSPAESLRRIEEHLASIALALDAWLELVIERFDPDIGRKLKENTVSLHVWWSRN